MPGPKKIELKQRLFSLTKFWAVSLKLREQWPIKEGCSHSRENSLQTKSALNTCRGQRSVSYFYLYGGSELRLLLETIL